jgi:hypothetical protein
MNMTVREQLEKIAEIINGKAWGLDVRKPRIYLNYRRDVSLWIEFANASYSSPDDQVTSTTGLFGACVRCYIAECRQTPAWYRSQRERAMRYVKPAFVAVLWYLATGDEVVARRIADDEIELSNDAVAQLTTGRADEARTEIGLACPPSST